MEPSNSSSEPLEAETNSLSNPQSTSTAQPQTETQAYVKAPSIFSLDVARAAGSWFNPWAWYGYGVMTESEKIKEAALARDRPSGASSSIASAATQEGNTSTGQIDSPTVGLERETQVTTPSVNPINPIADSASYMASGWASFFSLSRGRGLITKNLDDTVPEIEGLKDEVKRDENGMEIMELTDDEAGSVHVNLQQPERELEKAVTKVPASTGVSPAGPSSLPKDGFSTPPGTDGPKKEKEKEKSKAVIKSGTNTPAPPPPPPNLVLPAWEDTFYTPPRIWVPEQYLPTTNNATGGLGTTIGKTMRYMSGMLLGADSGYTSGGEKREKLRELLNWGHNLPRAWEVIEKAIETRRKSVGCKNVVVIGIHGWFPSAVMRSMLGEPTGTSTKFVNMMEQALAEFQSTHGLKFDKVTKIPLEGEGTIDRRIEKLYENLMSNRSWVDDIHNADVIFVATHSQGSVVSTHLIDRLIRDRHIRTAKNAASEPISDLGINMVPLFPQRVCCLCLCGIHLGPLRYLSSSSLLQPYIQYFESAAARELFEFQNTESDVSKAYVQALRNVLHNEIKMVYVASLNDQVVPIYSGLFTTACHPLILRALYIDGDAYHSSDFLTNLLVLLLRVLNCGLSDSGLLAHLSEATAGSLSGIGHSTAYEELSTFSLAVDYLFLTNNGLEDHPELTVEYFNASNEMNDYEIPWALRDLIADEKVTHHFSSEITQLRDAFREWHPKTTILRDIKRKLQPIQRLPTTSTPGTANNTSKL
ncbi:hypothetical protein EV368DRAFT_39790 [Lentinula lateritia]|nr:hypothetical protein EV368DRAFT_39790 [Lentinula lateritia]